MTIATVFNAYDVTQTAGPTSPWVANFDGKFVPTGGSIGTLFSYSFSLRPEYTLADLAHLYVFVSAGDNFKMSVNGGVLNEYSNGLNEFAYNITELTQFSYEVSNYQDGVLLSLLDSNYQQFDLVIVTVAVPVWKDYINTWEAEI